ncbi:MAG: hypothetical protein IJ009_06560 [Clostridia bacterium]|nr:hypothetical protein [Clostridia bacterium]
MKWMQNEAFLAEEFSDGELLLYDAEREVYHILNSSATKAFRLIVANGYDRAKGVYTAWVRQIAPNLSAEIAAEDFDGIFHDLTEKAIILQGNTTV